MIWPLRQNCKENKTINYIRTLVNFFFFYVVYCNKNLVDRTAEYPQQKYKKYRENKAEDEQRIDVKYLMQMWNILESACTI